MCIVYNNYYLNNNKYLVKNKNKNQLHRLVVYLGKLKMNIVYIIFTSISTRLELQFRTQLFQGIDHNTQKNL